MNKDELFDGFEKQFESPHSYLTFPWGGNDLTTLEEGGRICEEEKKACKKE